MKTLYVSDLDGTLLRSDETLSETTISTLNKLVDEGALFTYATARSSSTAGKITVGLRTDFPVVVYNGVFVMIPSTGVVLSSATFTDDEVNCVKSVLEKEGVSAIVYSLIDGRERVSWNINKVNPGMQRYLDSRKGDRRLRALESDDDLFEGQVYYFTLIAAEGELDAVYETFKDHRSFTCTHQKDIYNDDYWCEIMPKKATKANGIERLKEILHCDRVVSFGDAINDLPMFRMSDECYAVENAAAELKEKATAVIGSNNHDAVAKWIERDFYMEKEKAALLQNLRDLGINKGDTLLVHSSIKSIGTKLTPDDIISILQEAVGEEGNLLLPALSYDYVTPEQPVFDSKTTEPCIGLLPKVFLHSKGVVRSLHPTHSVCAWGKDSVELTKDHIKDHTPVGPNSPFIKLIEKGGKIMFIGEIVEHCTFMHGMEEYFGTDYVLEDHYTTYNIDGTEKEYINHDFRTVKNQRYDRIKNYVPYRVGNFGKGPCYVFNAAEIKENVIPVFEKDQHAFIDLK